MVTVKIQKPSLKTPAIKIEPDFPKDSSKLLGQNLESSSSNKVIKIVTTQSKKSIRSYLTADEIATATDHLIGKGMVEGQPFYLYFSNSQEVKDARWVNAADLRKNCKASLIRRTLFEGRLNIDFTNETSKAKTYVDTGYIQKYLAKKTKKGSKSCKVKAQELASKFFYDFEVLKLKMKGIDDVYEVFRPKNKNNTLDGVVSVHDEKQEPCLQKKKLNQKNASKVEDGQIQEETLLEISSQQSLEQSSEQPVDKSSEKLFSFNSSISQIKVKKALRPQQKQKALAKNSKDNNFKSFSSSLESFEGQKPISLNERIDFSKQEVTKVKYVGRIKEMQGNYENLYMFSLRYHPAFYSTMKIIKEDEFLLDAFLKFAEPLYEQYKR